MITKFSGAVIIFVTKILVLTTISVANSDNNYSDCIEYKGWVAFHLYRRTMEHGESGVIIWIVTSIMPCTCADHIKYRDRKEGCMGCSDYKGHLVGSKSLQSIQSLQPIFPAAVFSKIKRGFWPRTRHK